ncbi:MAG: nucleotide-binding protein [Desulfurococcaceae archaeon]
MSQENRSIESKHVVILDTSALLAKYYRYIDRSRYSIYTTESAVHEVKDYENKQALEEAIELGLLIVIRPRQDTVERTMHKARSIGALHKLSRTDIEIAGLAEQLKELGIVVIVITDDYELQNLLFHIEVGFKPLRTSGIRESRVYKAQCPVCGYVPGKPGENKCPLCNSEIRRRIVK